MQPQEGNRCLVKGTARLGWDIFALDFDRGLNVGCTVAPPPPSGGWNDSFF
jgi:hypothetical protein